MRVPKLFLRSPFERLNRALEGLTQGVARWFHPDSEQVEEEAPLLLASDTQVTWGGRSKSVAELAAHYLLLGMTESGKTLLLRMLLGRVLSASNSRGLVFDAKRDAVPMLEGFGVHRERIVLTNPFDARGSSWNLSEDIVSRASAWQLAELFIPERDQESQPYFTNAARHLLAQLVVNLQVVAPKAWQLRDLIEAAMSRDRLLALLQRTQEGEEVAEQHLVGQKQETAGSILSTLLTRLAPFEPVASLWHRADSEFSLSAWMRSEDSVLVMGFDEEFSRALNPLNALLFRRASELVLSAPDVSPKDPHTWLVLDEFRLLPKLEGLTALAVKGRSKGAHLVLTAQDVQGVRDVYGGDAAGELLGQCGNFGILRLNNPDTMKWASERFGEYEYWASTYTTGTSSQGYSASTSKSLQRRASVLPQEIAHLPKPNRADGIRGFFATMDSVPWCGHATPGHVEQWLSELSTSQGFEAAESELQERQPWDEKDYARLGLGRRTPRRGSEGPRMP